MPRPLLQIFLDELDYIRRYGLEVRDAANGNQVFTCYADLLNLGADLRWDFCEEWEQAGVQLRLHGVRMVSKTRGAVL
jgi:hypothetical protein